MFLHVSTIIICFGTKIQGIVIESSIGLGINLSSLSKMTSGKVNFDSYCIFERGSDKRVLKTFQQLLHNRHFKNA